MNSNPVELPRHPGSEKKGEDQTAQNKNDESGFAREEKTVTELQARVGKIDVDQEAHDEKRALDTDFQRRIKDDGDLPEILPRCIGLRSKRATNGTIFPQPDGEQFSVPDDVGEQTEEKEKAVPEFRPSIRKGFAKTRGRPHIQVDKFQDPISDAFWKDVWVASAEYNVGTLLPPSHLLTQDDR